MRPLLLQAIRATLGCEELQQLLAEVEAVLDEDAQVGCGSGRQDASMPLGALQLDCTHHASKRTVVDFTS